MEDTTQFTEGNTESINNNTETTLVKDETVACKNNKCDVFYRVLNIISFVGIVILFILFFTSKQSGKSGKVVNNPDGTPNSIAFVNSDTLMKNYKLFDVFKLQLENSKKNMEQEMALKASQFEKDVADFQKKVQSYSVTSDQAQKMESDLMKRQQQLLDLKETMTNQLMEEEYGNQTALFDSIIGALKVYNEDYNFDYILGYSKGSGILLANDKHDITPAIIEILNANFEKNKK